MRRDGLAAFVLRLAQRRAAASRRESSSARASGRRWSCNHSCAAQGWARRQGRGGRLPARSAWTPCPARRACRARRARALPVRPGPVAPSAPPGGPPARMGIVMAGRTAQGLMQPDLRLGLVTWTGQRAILRQPDQEPGWFRGRGVGVQAGCVFVQGTPCRQVAIRASDAHATPQTRADSASAWYSHSRAKSRLAARKRGTCQFMKSRSGALAKPLRRASCRAASCHCCRAKYTRLA